MALEIKLVYRMYDVNGVTCLWELHERESCSCSPSAQVSPLCRTIVCHYEITDSSSQ